MERGGDGKQEKKRGEREAFLAFTLFTKSCIRHATDCVEKFLDTS